MTHRKEICGSWSVTRNPSLGYLPESMVKGRTTPVRPLRIGPFGASLPEPVGQPPGYSVVSGVE